MGFFDKVKKALGSKKEDFESQNSVNIDEPTSTQSTENDNEEIQSNDSQETPANDKTNDNSSHDDKIRNFRYLDDLIHSGVKEIVLDSDIILGDGEESEYGGGIKLDVDDLVIDGNGHAVDAHEKARIFHCSAKNILIKGIVLKNGFSKGNGGAVYNETGELTITGSTLTDNRAQKIFSYCEGGAIYNNKGKLTIIESALNENTAQSSGGAICNNNGELTVRRCALNENTAKYGGAIYNEKGKLTITDSTLTGNTAHEGLGGAIHNWKGSLTITESTLNNNTAKSRGGAIDNDNGEVTIHRSTLTGNTAQEEGKFHGGGAIYIDEGSLTITETSLNNNTAKSRGGAIRNINGNSKIFNCEFSSNKSPNDIILNYDSLQIHNTTFKDNESRYIVLNAGNVANLGIFNGEFKKNNIEESVLCNSGKFCSVERTVFEDNITDNAINILNESELTLTNPKIKDKGKSILNKNYILIRKSAPELENKICGEGTVEVDEKIIPQGENFDFGYLDKKIHESNTQEIILDHDIILENYERDFYEGGIEIDIDNLVIDGNGKTIDASGKSRIFIITGKNITLKNMTLKNGHTYTNYDNPLNNNGGAIKINHNNHLTIENCEFLNNTSERDGGAIYSGSGELVITESTLTENTARDGGAIHNEGILTIHRSTLNNNTADYGGAIRNMKGSLTITDSTLTRNTARDGGAIHDYCGESAIIESTLTENTAQGTEIYNGGGAIHNEGILTIHRSTLNNNTAKHDGGAIRNRKGSLTITDSTLTGNTAQEGGAIHNYRRSETTITETTLNNNTADYGGAIHNMEAKLTITDSTLTGNTAQEGGAIHNRSESNIISSTFTENTTPEGHDSGAILNTGELIIISSTFTENTTQKGESIHNYGEMTITEITFDENGMNIFNNGRLYSKENIPNEIQIDGTGKFYHLKSLKNNQKDFTYLNELINAGTNEIKLENDIILNTENNEQKIFKKGIQIDRDNLVIDGNGHAIDAQDLTRIFYCTSKNITIKNIILKNGFAKEYGGAILSSGELTITESTLTGNTAKRDGGAIHNDGGSLTISESTLEENTSEQYNGGAIYNDEGSLTITETILNNNTAESRGGAIRNSGELTITESTLTGNTSKKWDGGAIYNNEGSLTITETILNNNTANNAGGAILNNPGSLTITDSTLNNNTADYGGGIYNKNGELTITDSTLNNNTAQEGGAIRNNDEKSFNITNCNLENNKPDDID